MTRLGRADLHVHTDASDGMATAEEMLVRAARAGLDIIAVTDHDDLRGGLRAQEAAARSGSAVRVIPGVELTTRGGHLLALFPGEIGAGQPTPDVPPLRSLAWTIAAVHAQGGVAIVAHPMAIVPLSAGRRALDRLAGRGGGVAAGRHRAGQPDAARPPARRGRATAGIGSGGWPRRAAATPTSRRRSARR